MVLRLETVFHSHSNMSLPETVLPFAIVKQRCETRVEVFCDQNEQFVYYDWIVTDYCPVFTVVGFLKSDIYEDVVYVKYESNSETFMCQMLADFVCKNGTRIYTKDYKNG